MSEYDAIHALVEETVPEDRRARILNLLENGDGDGEETGYDEFSVVDLRAELRDRDLSTSGDKKTLVARLEADDEEQEE